MRKQDSPTFAPLGRTAGARAAARPACRGLPAAWQAGGTVYEPCYDDPPAAACPPLGRRAESNDQVSTADEQVFPDYDQYDPGLVYD
jgi:hypothetical protein